MAKPNDESKGLAARVLAYLDLERDVFRSSNPGAERNRLRVAESDLRKLCNLIVSEEPRTPTLFG